MITAETHSAGTYRVTTPGELERIVARMSAKNPYVVVTRDDRPGFAQAHVGEAQATVLVEYRGGPRSMLNRTRLSPEGAAAVLVGWAFDQPGWRRGIPWERDKMERYCDTRSHCRFTPSANGVTCRLAGEPPPGLESAWEVAAEGKDEASAHAEWLTLTAVLMNTSTKETRIAWGIHLGGWVVEGKKPPSRLTAEQLARIKESSPMSWTGKTEDDAR